MHNTPKGKEKILVEEEVEKNPLVDL